MRTYNGGETVQGGFYWKRAGWRMLTVEGQAGVLPGEPGAAYYRVPALLLIPVALTMGGLFVLFLPLLGFLILGEWGFNSGGRLMRRVFGRKALRAPSAP